MVRMSSDGAAYPILETGRSVTSATNLLEIHFLMS
jgi:hypothetical protein